MPIDKFETKGPSKASVRTKLKWSCTTVLRRRYNKKVNSPSQSEAEYQSVVKRYPASMMIDIFKHQTRMPFMMIDIIIFVFICMMISIIIKAFSAPDMCIYIHMLIDKYETKGPSKAPVNTTPKWSYTIALHR